MSSFCVYRGIVIFKHQRNIGEKCQIIDHQQTFLILYLIKDNQSRFTHPPRSVKYHRCQ